MSDMLTQLGVGGIMAMLILREVFTFLGKRRNGEPTELSRDIRRIMSMTKDLHEWHNVTDTEGVKLWYVRRSLEDAVKELAGNIAMQTDLLRDLVREMHDMRRDVSRVRGSGTTPSE